MAGFSDYFDEQKANKAKADEEAKRAATDARSVKADERRRSLAPISEVARPVLSAATDQLASKGIEIKVSDDAESYSTTEKPRIQARFSADGRYRCMLEFIAHTANVTVNFLKPATTGGGERLHHGPVAEFSSSHVETAIQRAIDQIVGVDR